MCNEYSRGYADGLRELDHGHSFAEIERLREETSKLREALAFYADPATYDIDHLGKYGYIIIDKDNGEKAREALSAD